MEIHNILVGVDGSPSSTEACNVAAALAGALGCGVAAVHAVSKQYGEDSTRLHVKRAEELVEEARSLLKAKGVKSRGNTLLSDGSAVDAMIDFADEKFDLIVVGTRGLGGFKSMLLGSVSNGLVNHSRCAVLVVRKPSGRHAAGFRHIVAAVDGSGNSLRAVRMAAALAKGTGARLTVLSVIFTPAAVYYGEASESVLQMEKEGRVKAEQAVSRGSDEAGAEGVKARAKIVEDFRSPVQGIIEYSKKNRADLIVVGTRGLGGFKRLLLGSVASGVVNYAHCSVLVVRDS